MVSYFWFRRDLRLEDNAGLYLALKQSSSPVRCVFIFDENILSKLPKNDHRLTFIHSTLSKIKDQLETKGSTLEIFYGKPESVWKEILKNEKIEAVYTNRDYEPYARKRDKAIESMFQNENIPFHRAKDQVIFDPLEVIKDDKKPYVVFTPYSKKWKSLLKPFFYKSYPSLKYSKKLEQRKPKKMISLKEMGFEESLIKVPKVKFNKKLLDRYLLDRNNPAKDGTTLLGVHLRFGTVSIRKLVSEARSCDSWLNELIWREFFMQLLYYFPDTCNKDFRETFKEGVWENRESYFKAWKEGKTGFPIVDAGIRELLATGHMHNRVRMITASFLIKNLLVDWRKGERFFAEKLFDYELASNVGNWQWVAGCGADAAPYFRVFNPMIQQDKFDPDMEYIKKWIPEYGTDKYVKPIVDFGMSRNKFLFKTR